MDAPWLTDPGFNAVVDALAEEAATVLAVGGCVRNALLGRPVNDIDLATDLLPREVMRRTTAAGLRVVPTGIDHGTVTVLANGQAFEVTTFRSDIETDGRHAVVALGGTLEQDARRRDFTINALYADRQGTVIDPVGGLDDLHARRVRFIGDPDCRIREDYLRILRFFRFTAHYGDPLLGMDAEGLAACAANADGLDRLSRERVTAELVRLLSAPDPAPAVAAMQACGVLARVLPGADARWLAPVVAAEAVLGTGPDWRGRLAAIAPDDAIAGLRLSRADQRVIADIRAATAHPGDAAEIGHRFGLDIATSAIILRAAIVGAPVDPGALAAAQMGAEARFPVRAADLMPGLAGPALGARLEDLRQRWIASGFTATRDDLLG